MRESWMNNFCYLLMLSLAVKWLITLRKPVACLWKLSILHQMIRIVWKLHHSNEIRRRPFYGSIKLLTRASWQILKRSPFYGSIRLSLPGKSWTDARFMEVFGCWLERNPFSEGFELLWVFESFLLKYWKGGKFSGKQNEIPAIRLKSSEAWSCIIVLISAFREKRRFLELSRVFEHSCRMYP